MFKNAIVQCLLDEDEKYQVWYFAKATGPVGFLAIVLKKYAAEYIAPLCKLFSPSCVLSF
ncbi:MAG: hypothetical protein KTM48_01695 [Wolbachia endosymbiont of Pissodes strobi]|nr:hypothetical protein [Wolbachia endosymbiont of Pissodes strobi]